MPGHALGTAASCLEEAGHSYCHTACSDNADSRWALGTLSLSAETQDPKRPLHFGQRKLPAAMDMAARTFGAPRVSVLFLLLMITVAAICVQQGTYAAVWVLC